MSDLLGGYCDDVGDFSPGYGGYDDYSPDYCDNDDYDDYGNYSPGGSDYDDYNVGTSDVLTALTASEIQEVSLNTGVTTTTLNLDASEEEVPPEPETVEAAITPSDVPSDIRARGPLAIKTYNRALMDGKTYMKRVPVMFIGQDRTGKTSLKKSLKGETFNANESSTEGIETDPSHFKVSTEIWRTGKRDNESDPESKFLFEQNMAQLIFQTLKSVEELSVREDTSQFRRSEEPSTSSTMSSVADSEVTEKRTKNDSHLFAAKLPENVATLVENLLQNDEKAEEKDEIYSILWDFGGQSVYYATHPIFLTEEAIYILTCDLSHDPYEKANSPLRKGLYKNKKDISCSKTNMDYLDFWMSSVYSLVSPNTIGQDTANSETLTARLPPVFLVCTHADEPYCSTDPRELALDIYGFLRTKTYKRHMFKDVFVVDNTKSGSENECPEVVRLREEVLAVAQQLPQMKKAIPLNWLKYENILQLLRKEHYKWIPINDARQIACEKCGIDDDEQFRTLLDFLHDQRVLIHFNETPELQNMVVLDPQWLIDVFKKVITVKRYEHTEDTVEELWLKLEKSGILDERLLDHEWKPLFEIYSDETCKSLIAIMERFSLLCSWPSDSANKQYLVPSMLMSPPTDDVIEFLASVRMPSLFVRFESGRVPPGLFSRLVLHFYQWCNEDWKSQINPELFNNFALFHIRPDQGTSVIFMCHSSSIEIALHDGSDSLEEIMAGLENFDLTTSRAIQWKLRLILDCMRKEFGWLKNMRYEMCVCCPVCPKKGSVICRTHNVRGCECLHLLSQSELQKCQYCTRPGFRGDCRIRIKMFAPWFAFSGDVEERKCVSSKEEKSLTLPDGVLQTIQCQSSDCKDIVVRFQECLQLTDPAALQNPEPQTKRWIRCLANTAKSQTRTDLVEYLRTITPAGTTGPLLDEKLDFRCIPLKLRNELTFSLCGGDEWKMFAEKLGFSYNEIRYLDKRTTNPCDVVLDVMADHRFMSVGEVYDQLVKIGLPVLADLL